MIKKFYEAEPNGNNDKKITDKFLHVNSVGRSVCDSAFTKDFEKSRNDFRLLYLYHGNMNITSGKKKIPLKDGQIIIFPPHTPFTYENGGNTTFEYLWLNFTGAGAEDFINSVLLKTNTPIKVGIPMYIFEAYETLYAEYEDRTPFLESATAYKLMHILVLFGRASAKFNPKLIAKNKNAIDLGLLSKTITYINNNFAEDIHTEELAEMEHLSVSHFRRLFKTKTGMTPTQYITITRLKNAEECLLKTDMNIKQIAESVGFDNQLYFSRLFSRHFGKSPKDFRKQK